VNRDDLYLRHVLDAIEKVERLSRVQQSPE